MSKILIPSPGSSAWQQFLAEPGCCIGQLREGIDQWQRMTGERLQVFQCSPSGRGPSLIFILYPSGH